MPKTPRKSLAADRLLASPGGTPKAPARSTDWEVIEAEFRAGQLSLRELARQHNVSEGAIRKRAKKDGWTRPLADKVREAVREKLVRADGTQDGTHPLRASDAEIVAAASERGFNVQLSHRRDLDQLHGLKRILAERLAVYLDGLEPSGPFMGDKESPGDILEKLSRVTARLIPLERQAFNLDAATPHADGPKGAVTMPIDPVEAAQAYLRMMTGGT